MNAAKGKKQVQLTLTVEAYNRLQALAKDADRTLAGYLRWVFSNYLKELDANNQSSPSE
ncbi:MAG: hypothetical protein HDT14_10285 [Oscillibacter sp.]|nr:hypothetical protein [Oscillibacter sp.]